MNANATVINDTLFDRLLDEFRLRKIEEKRPVFFKRMELKDACKSFVEDFAAHHYFTFVPIKNGDGVIFINDWALVAMVFTDPDCAIVDIYAVENGIEELEPVISTGRVYD